MKTLALIMIFSVVGVVLSAEEYTIQTISTLKESSITPAFEKKVEKSALPSTKKKEGQCNIVTVGKYDTLKKAQKDLRKAKAIAKDAFVRPSERTTPKVCMTSTAAADKKGDKVLMSDTNATMMVSKNDTHPTAVTVTDANKKTVPVTAVLSTEAKMQPCKSELKTESTPSVFIYDRNLARKSDIHEAIEYYENSPYYSFKPLAMQQ
ncbi:MAG: hypothetical protein WCS55_07250 [Sulfuricurvum sp.]|uniref:hypothetical protein n=1 Tax=Sulfuricurvum sp. TaxID=2025608 RepID=UPI0026200C3B|nr:hypothetical protein [uncultured Sulfuricurvum sp.]